VKKNDDAMSEIELKIKTLTPLWTGDINRECNRIKETGIIGSLRWWYEALVRGMGGYACDPTSDRKCIYEGDVNKICPVCQLFGCTDWRRKFGLKISDNTSFESEIGRIEVESRFYRDRQGRSRIPKYFLSPGRKGYLDLEIMPLRCNESELNALKLSLKVIEEWCALGAKTHLGYGVFRLIKGGDERYELTSEDVESALSHFERVRSNVNSNLPDLKWFFFSKACLDDSFINEKARIIKSLELRYDLRRLFGGDRDLRYDLMGTIKGERRGSKIYISRVYQILDKNEIRIWGWIPRVTSNRDNIIEKIKEKICELDDITWREFNSDRDNKQKTDDISRFIKENLLGG
jgi:CRISPR-associated protein Cmr1